ncbi:MAG: hypothetical protein ABEI80_02545 [Haloplanus sp.]
MLQRNSETLATYGVLTILAVAGVGGLISAQQSLQYTGVVPAVLNAAGGVLLLALVAVAVRFSR